MSGRRAARRVPGKRGAKPLEETAKAVRAILRQPWSLDPWRLEGIAQSLHDALDKLIAQANTVVPIDGLPDVLFWPAELFVAILGYQVIDETSGPCGQEGLLPGLLFVRPCACDRKWTLRILHELAHALLRKYRHHTHADVWALTLALAVPRRKFRHLDLAVHIPAWARDERRFLGRMVERAA